ncbi:MAG: hypothetical protein KAT50_08815, partial [Pirellulales bacterium]|nr:hypothetical protein [Pirellulales bacterium]
MASIWRRAWRGLVPGKRRRNRKKLESQGIEDSSSGIVRGLQLESLEKRYALDASPVLDPSASPALDVISEDAGVPVGAVGTLVSSFIDDGGVLNNYSDADGELPGIAITDVNLNGGTLYFSIDNGTSWTDVGAVSEISALVLNADSDTRIAFTPADDFNGEINDVITFRAWDRGAGFSNGESGVDARTGIIGNYNTSGLAQGVVISSDGNTAFVADNFNGLEILDVTDPLNITSLATFSTSGIAQGVTLSPDGNTAYVAVNDEGLDIVDVTTPSSPSLRATYNTNGVAVNVDVKAHPDGRMLAYIADSDNGLVVLDVSDGDNPTLVYEYFDGNNYYDVAALSLPSSEPTTAGNHVGLVGESIDFVRDDVEQEVYTGIAAGNSGLGVEEYTTSTDLGGHQFLFVADGNNGLRWIDMSSVINAYGTTDAPRLAATYDSPGIAQNVNIASDGSYVFVADDHAGVQRVALEWSGLDSDGNVATSTMTHLDTIDTGGLALDVDVFSSSDRESIYVADHHTGLQVMQFLRSFSTSTDTVSVQVLAQNDPPTGGVTITGVVTEGEVLTADTSTLADADGLGVLNYQW